MAGHFEIDHHAGGEARSRLADRAIAALADAQHGVVSRTQLLSAGVSGRQVDRRVERRLLRVLHRGVYAVGHRALTAKGIWMAAVLAAGDGAVLSHWSAASLWRLRSGRGPRSHVTARGRRASRQGIAFHHALLPGDEITVRDGIPATTPARTILDLAHPLPSPTLARVIDAAGAREGAPLAALLDRYPRKPGAAKLRSLLGEPQPMTRSDFEARVLDLIDRAGLPRPRVNANVDGFEVDFAWTEHGVIAELDTYATHGSRFAFEQDRARDRRVAGRPHHRPRDQRSARRPQPASRRQRNTFTQPARGGVVSTRSSPSHATVRARSVPTNASTVEIVT
jgi:hypothetical protein